MSDEVFERGMDLRRKMFGAEATDQRVQTASDFVRPLENFVTDECFGDTWNRGVLDHKTRSMITIAMLTALGGQGGQIRNHVKGAINNGVSKDEIREILRHAAIYCGVPRSVDAFINAEAMLKEMGLG
jgi:4-carboxymuconolactone decarboxylase